MTTAQPGDCSICLDGMEDSEADKYLGCGHGFHLRCIMEWGGHAPLCPLCRAEFSADFPLAIDINWVHSVANDAVLGAANEQTRAAVAAYNSHVRAGAPGRRRDLDAVVLDMARAVAERHHSIATLATRCDTVSDRVQLCRQGLVRLSEGGTAGSPDGREAVLQAVEDLADGLRLIAATAGVGVLDTEAVVLEDCHAFLLTCVSRGEELPDHVLADLVSVIDRVRATVAATTAWCSQAAEDNRGLWEAVDAVAVPLGLSTSPG